VAHEDYIVNEFVKPAVLCRVDPNQYGAIPRPSLVFDLLSMIHKWNAATDGTGATLVYDLPQWVFKWIRDFLTDRKQRVKLNQNSYSDWADISAGVPQRQRH
jgi:hypothetical protein